MPTQEKVMVKGGLQLWYCCPEGHNDFECPLEGDKKPRNMMLNYKNSVAFGLCYLEPIVDVILLMEN